MVIQNAVACSLSNADARHAGHDRRQKVVIASGVPIEQPADRNKCVLSGNGAAVVLNVIQKPDNLAAFDAVDRPRAKLWKHMLPKYPLPEVDRTHVLPFAREELFGDSAQAVAVGIPSAPEFVDWITTAGERALSDPGFVPGIRKRRRAAARRCGGFPALPLSVLLSCGLVSQKRAIER